MQEAEDFQASLDHRKLSQTKQTWSSMDTVKQALGLQESVPARRENPRPIFTF